MKRPASTKSKKYREIVVTKHHNKDIDKVGVMSQNSFQSSFTTSASESGFKQRCSLQSKKNKMSTKKKSTSIHNTANFLRPNCETIIPVTTERFKSPLEISPLESDKSPQSLILPSVNKVNYTTSSLLENNRNSLNTNSFNQRNYSSQQSNLIPLHEAPTFQSQWDNFLLQHQQLTRQLRTQEALQVMLQFEEDLVKLESAMSQTKEENLIDVSLRYLKASNDAGSAYFDLQNDQYIQISMLENYINMSHAFLYLAMPQRSYATLTEALTLGNMVIRRYDQEVLLYSQKHPITRDLQLILRKHMNYQQKGKKNKKNRINISFGGNLDNSSSDSSFKGSPSPGRAPIGRDNKSNRDIPIIRQDLEGDSKDDYNVLGNFIPVQCQDVSISAHQQSELQVSSEYSNSARKVQNLKFDTYRDDQLAKFDELLNKFHNYMHTDKKKDAEIQAHTSTHRSLDISHSDFKDPISNVKGGIDKAPEVSDFLDRQEIIELTQANIFNEQIITPYKNDQRDTITPKTDFENVNINIFNEFVREFKLENNTEQQQERNKALFKIYITSMSINLNKDNLPSARSPFGHGQKKQVTYEDQSPKVRPLNLPEAILNTGKNPLRDSIESFVGIGKQIVCHNGNGGLLIDNIQIRGKEIQGQGVQNSANTILKPKYSFQKAVRLIQCCIKGFLARLAIKAKRRQEKEGNGMRLSQRIGRFIYTLGNQPTGNQLFDISVFWNYTKDLVYIKLREFSVPRLSNEIVTHTERLPQFLSKHRDNPSALFEAIKKRVLVSKRRDTKSKQIIYIISIDQKLPTYGLKSPYTYNLQSPPNKDDQLYDNNFHQDSQDTVENAEDKETKFFQQRIRMIKKIQRDRDKRHHQLQQKKNDFEELRDDKEFQYEMKHQQAIAIIYRAWRSFRLRTALEDRIKIKNEKLFQYHSVHQLVQITDPKVSSKDSYQESDHQHIETFTDQIDNQRSQTLHVRIKSQPEEFKSEEDYDGNTITNVYSANSQPFSPLQQRTNTVQVKKQQVSSFKKQKGGNSMVQSHS
ncbi:UNKNOWN [Stylonychia lemnae]|uniref:IQ calmodulin-binding motif family protein n=1 Tax=Stylonychia lemnae TaxID=5949 RepID=A0A078B8R0_STYLE|nr:UNKNOWN [Stylonychia lemnae]|eukprot:CDW90804.1 UNKNOWN [Stylonychia lemnae]